MTRTAPPVQIVLLTVGLAAVLWFAAFYLTVGVFWIKISVSASGLAILSCAMQPDIVRRLRLSPKTILLGLSSAVALYLIFWAGKLVSIHLFSFAGQQIGSIYDKKGGALDFLVRRTTVTNQDGVHVADLQNTTVQRNG